MADLVDSYFKGARFGNEFYNKLIDQRLQQAAKRVALDASQMQLEDANTTREARVRAALAKLNNLADSNEQSIRFRKASDGKALEKLMTGLDAGITTNKVSNEQGQQALGILEATRGENHATGVINARTRKENAYTNLNNTGTAGIYAAENYASAERNKDAIGQAQDNKHAIGLGQTKIGVANTQAQQRALEEGQLKTDFTTAAIEQVGVDPEKLETYYRDMAENPDTPAAHRMIYAGLAKTVQGDPNKAIAQMIETNALAMTSKFPELGLVAQTAEGTYMVNGVEHTHQQLKNLLYNAYNLKSPYAKTAGDQATVQEKSRLGVGSNGFNLGTYYGLPQQQGTQTQTPTQTPTGDTVTYQGHQIRRGEMERLQRTALGRAGYTYDPGDGKWWAPDGAELTPEAVSAALERMGLSFPQ